MAKPPSIGGEQRRFYRWKVAIPCQIDWQGELINCKITELSFGGAELARAEILIPPGVLLRLYVRVGPYATSLPARVVHSRWHPEEGSSLGIEFKEPAEQRSDKLIPIWRSAAGSGVKKLSAPLDY